MSDFDFFLEFFGHLEVFLPAMGLMMALLYLSVRSIAPAGYLDPLHFYWAFTFGSAYGVVISLFILGHIDLNLFSMVCAFGLLFFLSFRFFIKSKKSFLLKNFVRLLIPSDDGKLEFSVVLVTYILLLGTILIFVGSGMFAETNRFEQNRGFGPLVRVADGLRLFVVAYIALLLFKRYRKVGKITWRLSIYGFLFLVLIVIGAVVNGSKFGLLEAIYAVVLALSVYFKKPKFNFLVAVSVMFSALSFAILVLAANLNNEASTGGAEPSYMAGNSLVLERLVLRILANADKYYFSLPNHVIDELKTDNIIVTFLTPFVGTGRMSSLVGHDVAEYGIGRQTLMYFYPDNDVAGGPTSHFDLFAYKYFGWLGGPFFIIFISFLFSSIMLLTRHGKDKIFYSSLAAALWLRAQAIILEPTIGFSYVFDIFILFFLVKVLCACFHRRISSNE